MSTTFTKIMQLAQKIRKEIAEVAHLSAGKGGVDLTDFDDWIGLLNEMEPYHNEIS